MKCENCDLPLATDEDFQKIPPGEGEHLCWSRYGTKCEPEDWRARALAAEAERDQARIDMEAWKHEAEAEQADFAMWFRLANDERKVMNELRAEIEKLKEDLLFQTTDAVWYEDAVEICQQRAYEIARSVPAPEHAKDRQGPMMNNYWRWALWEDCLGYAPEQVYRVMQTLCAAQMEIGMMRALESK